MNGGGVGGAVNQADEREEQWGGAELEDLEGSQAKAEASVSMHMQEYDLQSHHCMAATPQWQLHACETDTETA